MIQRSNPDRLRRSRIFYAIFGFIAISVIVLLLGLLQSLILPTLIGMFAAYISLPVLNLLRRRGIPKGIGVLLMFGGLIFLILTIGRQLIELIPNEQQLLELRVSTQYQINKQFLNFFGKPDFKPESDGNFLYEMVGDEVTPLLGTLNGVLRLSKEEDQTFLANIETDEASDLKEKALEYYHKLQAMNILIIDVEQTTKSTEVKDDSGGGFILAPDVGFSPSDSKIASFLSAISIWIILPFVFIFLLLDEGEVKHYLLGIVPNRYFEMALTTFDNVDRAIGNYIRGTILESSLVGLTFLIGLSLMGFDLQAATLIGAVAGLANAIPFLGPVLGLLVGVLYALIVQDIQPLIPFITPESAVIRVVIVVVIAQLLDNAVFQPLVLGKAVNLHPLVVVLGVTSGSIIFGFAGLLFAIPTIVILNVVVATIFKQLKAYFIIY